MAVHAVYAVKRMKIVLFFGIVVSLISCGPASKGTEASPEEAKAYIRSLALSGVEMKAAESFGGQQLVEITGKITNNGGRALKKVELICIFSDPYNQVIFRDTVAIVRADRDGLKPGETKPFRLPFDTIPKTWNQTLPQMVIGGVLFE